MKTLDIVIPVFNEELHVVEETIAGVIAACATVPSCTTRVIVVNDGSDGRFQLGRLEDRGEISYVEHSSNRGYGAALKSGIQSGSAEWIGIIDADGTYPADKLPSLLQCCASADMVVGTRTTGLNETPILRRVGKVLLNAFASYLTGRRICDVNSGLRIFSRGLCSYLWELFPERFSFTTTMTIGALVGGFRVTEVPIDYYRRSGKSTLDPIKDTFGFFGTVFRLALLFAPLRVFGTLACVLCGLGFVKGVLRDYVKEGHIGNGALILMLAGMQVFLLGLLAELINLNGKLRRQHVPHR